MSSTFSNYSSDKSAWIINYKVGNGDTIIDNSGELKIYILDW
jgi:hypothetical protein